MKKSGDTQIVPTSTAIQPRIRLFQPSQRPKMMSGEWMETSFGRCKVEGRLGQRHADLLESVMVCAEKRRDIEDGGVVLLVDPARLRRTMSNNQYSYEQINKLITELRMATITIESPKWDSPLIGGLIDHKVLSPMTRKDPLTGTERHLWRIRLGTLLVLLLERDVALYHDPVPLTQLQHGISQAVARHVLSHQMQPKGGWKLETVLGAVAGPLSSQDLRNAKRRLKEDMEGLLKIGIQVDSENARITKT
jgi:hypothetical protein